MTISNALRSAAHFLCPKIHNENGYSEAIKLLSENDLLTDKNKEWVLLHNDCSKGILERLVKNDLLTQPNLNLIFKHPDNVQKIAGCLKLLDEVSFLGAYELEHGIFNGLLGDPEKISSTFVILANLHKANLIIPDTLVLFSMDDLASVAIALACLSNRGLLTLDNINKSLMCSWTYTEFAEKLMEQDQAKPLTQMDLDLLFEKQPGYAYVGPNFIGVLSILRDHHCLNPITRQALCAHPNDVDNIIKFAKALEDRELLTEGNLEALLVNPRDWTSILSGIDYLRLDNLLNSENFKLLLITPRHAHSMARMILCLNARELLSPENRNRLLALPKVHYSMGDIVECLFHSGLLDENFEALLTHAEQTEFLAPEVQKLAVEDLLAQDNLDVLFAHPEHAATLVQGIINWNSSSNPRDEIYNSMLAHPEHAYTLLLASIGLELSGVWNEDNYGCLLTYPQHAQRLAIAIGELGKAQILTPENRQLLMNHPDRACFIARSLSVLQRKNLGEYREKVIAQIDYIAHIDGILRQLEEVDLLTNNLDHILACPEQTRMLNCAIACLISYNICTQPNLDKLFSDNGAHIKEICDGIKLPMNQTDFDRIVAEAKEKKRAPSRLAGLMLGKRSKAIQKGQLKGLDLPHELNGAISSFLSPKELAYDQLATEESEKAFGH